MDYNKDGKGFVCFIYRLTQKRLFFVVLTLISLVIIIVLNSSKFNTNLQAEFNITNYALCLLAFALGSVIVKPSLFLLKLAGFLTALASAGVALHHLNRLGSGLFYLLAIFGLFLLVILFSWFVYNARSSEINEI